MKKFKVIIYTKILFWYKKYEFIINSDNYDVYNGEINFYNQKSTCIKPVYVATFKADKYLIVEI